MVERTRKSVVDPGQLLLADAERGHYIQGISQGANQDAGFSTQLCDNLTATGKVSFWRIWKFECRDGSQHSCTCDGMVFLKLPKQLVLPGF